MRVIDSDLPPVVGRTVTRQVTIAAGLEQEVWALRDHLGGGPAQCQSLADTAEIDGQLADPHRQPVIVEFHEPTAAHRDRRSRRADGLRHSRQRPGPVVSDRLERSQHARVEAAARHPVGANRCADRRVAAKRDDAPVGTRRVGPHECAGRLESSALRLHVAEHGDDAIQASGLGRPAVSYSHGDIRCHAPERAHQVAGRSQLPQRRQRGRRRHHGFPEAPVDAWVGGGVDVGGGLGATVGAGVGAGGAGAGAEVAGTAADADGSGSAGPAVAPGTGPRAVVGAAPVERDAVDRGAGRVVVWPEDS